MNFTINFVIKLDFSANFFLATFVVKQSNMTGDPYSEPEDDQGEIEKSKHLISANKNGVYVFNNNVCILPSL